MSRWKLEMPFQKTVSGDQVRLQKTVLESRFGELVIVKTGASKLEREIAQQRIFEVYQRPLPWALTINDELVTGIEAQKLVGCVPPISLPSLSFNTRSKDVLFMLGGLAKFSSAEFKTVEQKMNLMGFSQLWNQPWSHLEYRQQIQLKLAIFAQRFKLIFYFLNERKVSLLETKTPVFEGIRTVCGTFQVSTILLLERAVQGYAYVPLISEGITIEAFTESYSEIA